MDPVVEAFQRINPTDHSLDGLPVTVVVVALVPAKRDGRR
jgi:hypothetical protein